MALHDLDASINLIPLRVSKNLGIGDIKPITMSLQIADRSIRRPKGILEDVWIKVNTYIPYGLCGARYGRR